MKIITLNTHSLIEENYPEKLQATIDYLAEAKADIIAMQEVNQSIDAAVVSGGVNYHGKAPLKADNHGLKVVEGLSAQGEKYFWLYGSCHVGYSRYDEGVALFSRHPILEYATVNFSKSRSYTNFQTRKALLAKVKIGKQIYLCVSTHMGWWQRDSETFVEQWDNLMTAVKAMINPGEIVLLMGDLNAPATVKHQGYDYAMKHFQDTYVLAETRDDGNTANAAIDGWQGQKQEKMRIDYILSSGAIAVATSKVIFNGVNGPVVSDHYGVEITLKGE